MMICIMSKVRTRTKIEKGEKMCEFDEKLENAHMGRLIHMLSHQMKRNSNGMESVIGNDELTVMQKHVLKFVLLESLHRDLYQKDIEEDLKTENLEKNPTKQAFVLPPVQFIEVEELEDTCDVVSSSPDPLADLYLKEVFNFEDDPKLASILVGFNIKD